jgi:hypothetical protein
MLILLLRHLERCCSGVLGLTSTETAIGSGVRLEQQDNRQAPRRGIVYIVHSSSTRRLRYFPHGHQEQPIEINEN